MINPEELTDQERDILDGYWGFGKGFNWVELYDSIAQVRENIEQLRKNPNINLVIHNEW